MSKLPHEHVYIRLGVSKIHGVGVFAICPIPSGTMVFESDSADLVWVHADAIKDLPAAQQRLYKDFGLWRGEQVGCPASFDVLTPGWFVNHNPDDPNLRYDLREYSFYAARDIELGEELTANYHLYADNQI